MEAFDIIVTHLEKAGLTYRQSIWLIGQLLWEERELIERKDRKDIIETFKKKEV